MTYNTTSNRFRITLTLLAALLFLAAGCAKKPETTAGRFDYRHIELDNGLDVITLEDFSCPIVAVQIWYHVGSKNEQPDRQGFAHMFEHMMFRGTDKLGPTDHFAFIRRVGGTTNGYTGFDRTVYLETLPAEQLELALWLEAERMTFLKIDQEAFDTERKVVEEERRMGLNQPYGTIVENLLAEVFEVHPYRWPPIGKIPHLRASSVQELRDFWQRHYVPSNSTLLIVGAVSHADARQLAKKYFGWIPRYDEPPKVTAVEPRPEQARSVTLDEDNAPAPAAGLVYKTVPVSHTDSVALDILAEILGGGKSSRLYRELVAEKQLAVQAQAFSMSFEQDGVFAAGAVMTPFGGDANSVLEVIQGHIDRFRTEPVTDRELTKAKNQMLRSLVTGNLTIESKARMLGSAAVEYGDVSQVNRWLDDIRKVTADDILRVANEYLSPHRALKANVERNLLGAAAAVMGKKSEEEQSPITAEPELTAPAPGRGGLARADDHPKDPPFGKISPAKLTPNYTSSKLTNGLKVIVVPNHEVPFITVQLGLLPGAWTEDKPGTAAMTLSMLTKGTTKHTEGELADELETYAINLSGAGAMDTSTVNLSCLTEHIGRAAKLLAEVVLSPTFPDEEFEKLRKQVLTSLAVQSAEPTYQANRQLRRSLYGEHPYSRTATGEIEDVNALAVDDLKQWWAGFARPDMAVLIFAGDIDPPRAFDLTDETFGDWQAAGPKPDIELPQLAKPDQTHIYLVDRPGSIQSQIRAGQLGITRHDEGYFVSRIVSNYFGWAFNSRLNETIRVAKGLTYGVWGGYSANRFAGQFNVGTFTKTESTPEAVQAVLDEIQRLKTEAPTDEELENSRSYILGSFVRQREIPQQIAGDLWLIESQQLGADYLERLLAAIAAAERPDCERLVQSTIETDKLIVVVVGEAEKLKDPLEQIAPVTVIPAQQQGSSADAPS
ncbi:MAG: insulinase family protein [Planctomycetota bacterium]|nr:MAG: insulinase family protein [Planctomycetota bacterium]